MRPTLLLPLLLLGHVGSVAAQSDREPIAAGRRIRVTAPRVGLTGQSATFQRIEHGWLVATADSSLRVPLDAVVRIDVQVGTQAHPWRGAGIGFLGGAVLGFGLWYAADAGCYPEADTIGCATVYGAGGGGVLGAIVGAIVGGLLLKTDRWEPVSLERVRVSLPTRTAGGIAVRFSVVP